MGIHLDICVCGIVLVRLAIAVYSLVHAENYSVRRAEIVFRMIPPAPPHHQHVWNCGKNRFCSEAGMRQCAAERRVWELDSVINESG